MDDETITLIVCVLLLSEAYEYLKIINGASRRFWVRQSYKERDTHGFFALNFDHLYNDSPKQFQQAVRMKKEVFDELFNLVEEDLTKHSNRPVISAKCRLFLTLVYLAQGGSKQMFSIAFKMGLTSVKKIVNETCDVLWNSLGHKYLPVPNQIDWRQISSDFQTMWNLPNCVGAIDGKHISITFHSNSGYPYNYKGVKSLVLLGTCDSNYTFTGIDVGAFCDGGVLWRFGFGQKLFENQLTLPEDTCLPNSDVSFPHYFVGDSGFPLKPFLMRPYPGERLPSDRNNFNKRLSKARGVIENAFGVLVSRWKILLGPLQMAPESAEKIVKATIVLHNFVKVHDDTYIPPDYVDRNEDGKIVNGLWREEQNLPLKKPRKFFSNNATQDAFRLRDQLKDYLVFN